MTTTCTIYWDSQNHMHHKLISEVAENGSHRVIHSNIWDNMLSATWTRDEAIKVYGAANVRFYKITEMK